MKDIKKLARELARVSPHSTQNYISWAYSLAYKGYSPEEIASIMDKRAIRVPYRNDKKFYSRYNERKERQMDKMINNLSGSITKGKYKLSWYINTETKKGNILLKDTETKTIKGTGLEEAERKTEIIDLEKSMHHLVEGGIHHLIYENKYIRIHCISSKDCHMITEYINWEQIHQDMKPEKESWDKE